MLRQVLQQTKPGVSRCDNTAGATGLPSWHLSQIALQSRKLCLLTYLFHTPMYNGTYEIYGMIVRLLFEMQRFSPPGIQRSVVYLLCGFAVNFEFLTLRITTPVYNIFQRNTHTHLLLSSSSVKETFERNRSRTAVMFACCQFRNYRGHRNVPAPHYRTIKNKACFDL